jgi:hypothetical protein
MYDFTIKKRMHDSKIQIETLRPRKKIRTATLENKKMKNRDYFLSF